MSLHHKLIMLDRAIVTKGTLKTLKYIGSGIQFFNEQNHQKLEHCSL